MADIDNHEEDEFELVIQDDHGEHNFVERMARHIKVTRGVDLSEHGYANLRSIYQEVKAGLDNEEAAAFESEFFERMVEEHGLNGQVMDLFPS